MNVFENVFECFDFFASVARTCFFVARRIFFSVNLFDMGIEFDVMCFELLLKFILLFFVGFLVLYCVLFVVATFGVFINLFIFFNVCFVLCIVFLSVVDVFFVF